MDKVSVIVVTFNSADVVIDTIKSIYEQTYENIELIVQDDHSTDDTVSLIEKWCIEHDASRRFTNVVISSNLENLGTSQNLNEGCKKATGRWIKDIGGDDLLTKDCIEKNVEFATKIDEDALIMSDVIDFYQNGEGVMVKHPFDANSNVTYLRRFNQYGSDRQYRIVMRSYCLDSPTFFYSKKGLEEIK